MEIRVTFNSQLRRAGVLIHRLALALYATQQISSGFKIRGKLKIADIARRNENTTWYTRRREGFPLKSMLRGPHRGNECHARIYVPPQVRGIFPQSWLQACKNRSGSLFTAEGEFHWRCSPKKIKGSAGGPRCKNHRVYFRNRATVKRIQITRAVKSRESAPRRGIFPARSSAKFLFGRCSTGHGKQRRPVRSYVARFHVPLPDPFFPSLTVDRRKRLSESRNNNVAPGERE